MRRISVRTAHVKDLKAINELTDTMHHYLAGLYGLEFSDEEMKEEHYDEDDLKETYVAEEVERGVVGYLSFSLGRDEWAGPHLELEHLVVQEDCRGLGVARRLFRKLFERARQEGVNITTGTLAKNERAIKFYEKLGFKPLSVRLLLDLQKRIVDK